MAKADVLKSSQPAAAPSPVETNTETPSASACCHIALMNALPPGPCAASHPPKLRLMIGGGVFSSSKFCAAINAPKFVDVSAHEASSTCASGAAAPAHSASSAASPSSPFLPGFEQPAPG